MRDRFAQLNYSGKLTLYGIALATLHLILAGFGFGRFYELWSEAWPFYNGLVFTTTASGVVLHVQKKRREAEHRPEYRPPYEPELNQERESL